MEKHKCADCGFLATWNNGAGQWEEVEHKQRETGQSQARGAGRIPFEAMGQFSDPFCLIRAFDLPCEYKQERSENRVLAVLQRERDCPSFREWQQGFSPKEHREMMDREKMLKWQTDREDKDKEWQRGQNRQMVILGAIIGGIFGLITTVLGIVLTYLLTHGGSK